jgi:nucleobase:cation symporter-1, NCS1 family
MTGDAAPTSDGRDARLSNPDLAPTDPKQRTWNLWHYASLWVGMAVCIPTYTLASSLIDKGMSWSQAILTIALGNAIVLVPMLLNAHAGTRYGIPFPVFARAAFGVLGANVPAMLRALVACGWFGIQTWFGGAALYQLARVLWPGLDALPAILPDAIGLSTGQALGFALFWAINVYFIWNGTEAIKWLELLSAPFLIVVGLVLLAWAWNAAGGFGPMLSQPSRFENNASFLATFFPSLTAMIGFWATLSLNIPDFTRFAKSQKDQMLGQAIGLPTTMTLFAFIGVAVTSATPLIFAGETIWDPVVLLGRIGGGVTTVVAMLALSVATLSTNIAANVVSPANDFSNLAPRIISSRTGGMITAVIGILIMPWKLVASPDGYIFTWLIGYSALLGPIGGILIADYFVLRKRTLDVDGLYRRGGPYEYRSGFNLAALAALVLAILPCAPGFLHEAFPRSFAGVPGVWTEIYHYAWFVGFGVAAITYLAFMRIRRSA